MGLSASIQKALTGEGYTEPTPIQTQAIPIVLSGRDLIGLAQTGTGKTAAFALPILDRLAADRRHPGARGCRALILSPTRELASQIADSFRTYGRFLGMSTTVVFGGASMFKQKKALERGVDILVATPGRLLDHVSQRSLRLDNVEVLVLDEADHMMDLGFIVPLQRITQLLPKSRQTLFFSATMPPEIAELASRFLTDPIRIAVTPPATTAERVEQKVIHIAQGAKQDLLHSLLQDPGISRALVFTRTKFGADRVVKRLEDHGFAAEAIHGNKSQGQRERALDNFRRGRARLLIATEIAARGIDVDQVSHVINFDLPNVPEQYVHRIGRTARAGATGQAISFCAPDERAYLRDIERLTGLKLQVEPHEMALHTPAPGDRIQAGKHKGGRDRPQEGRQQERRPRKAYEPQTRGSADDGRWTPRGEPRSRADFGHRAPRRAEEPGSDGAQARRSEGAAARPQFRDDVRGRNYEGHRNHGARDAHPDHRSHAQRGDRPEGRSEAGRPPRGEASGDSALPAFLRNSAPAKSDAAIAGKGFDKAPAQPLAPKSVMKRRAGVVRKVR